MTISQPNDTVEQTFRDPAPRPTLAAETLATVAVITLALIAAVALLWLLSDVVLMLFAAILLACQLQGAAAYVARHTPLSYGIALVVVILAIVAVLGLAFWYRGPFIFEEGKVIGAQVHEQIETLWHGFNDAAWLKDVSDRVDSYVSGLRENMTGMAAGLVTSTLGNFGTVLLIVVAAIYLAAGPKQYVDGIIALIPSAWRPRGKEVMASEGHTLRWWFIGQLADMTAIGVLTGIGLKVLGVKLYFTLAIIAALFNFVPYIGALAGSVPAIIVALSNGPRTAIYVAILFVAVQTFEGNVLSPLIQKRTVDLPPVVTLLSQTVLGTLFGPLGLILATPITAAILLLVRMVYVETILGGAPPKEAGHRAN